VYCLLVCVCSVCLSVSVLLFVICLFHPVLFWVVSSVSCHRSGQGCPTTQPLFLLLLSVSPCHSGFSLYDICLSVSNSGVQSCLVSVESHFVFSVSFYRSVSHTSSRFVSSVSSSSIGSGLSHDTIVRLIPPMSVSPCPSPGPSLISTICSHSLSTVSVVSVDRSHLPYQSHFGLCRLSSPIGSILLVPRSIRMTRLSSYNQWSFHLFTVDLSLRVTLRVSISNQSLSSLSLNLSLTRSSKNMSRLSAIPLGGNQPLGAQHYCAPRRL